MHHTFADTQYGPEFMPLAELVAEQGLQPGFHLREQGNHGGGRKSHERYVFFRCKSLVDSIEWHSSNLQAV